MIAILRITWSLTTSENHLRGESLKIAAECLGVLFRRHSAGFITTTSGFEFSVPKISTRQIADKRYFELVLVLVRA